MAEYKNLYDLLDLDKDASQSEVNKKTKKALRNSHPDRNDDTTPSQFETIKKAREILTDEETRRKYDNLGHNKYVNSELDKPLQGYSFADSSSLSEMRKKDHSSEDEEISDGDDVDDIIGFSSNNSSMSGAIKQDNESSVSASKKTSEGHAAKVRKQRDDVKEAQTSEKVTKSAGFFVTMGAVLTDDIVQLSSLLIILLGLYGFVFSIFGGLGVAFAVAFSMGLFYFPAFRKLLSFD